MFGNLRLSTLRALMPITLSPIRCSAWQSSQQRVLAGSVSAPVGKSQNVAYKGAVGEEFFSRGRIATLERSIGSAAGTDLTLWTGGPFAAEVYPDLPVAMTWADLVNQTAQRGCIPAGKPVKLETYGSMPNRWVVRSVGMQMQSLPEARDRLMRAAGLDQDGKPLQDVRRANALLLVSGSHPARAIAAPLGLVPNSMDLLRKGAEMRSAGLLPADISLWAVENPLTSDPVRLAGKNSSMRLPDDLVSSESESELLVEEPGIGAVVEAGAEAIITQPPLLWSKFEAWMDGVTRLRLDKAVRLIIGTTVITSARNLRFWLGLCGVENDTGAVEALAELEQVEATLSKQGFAEFCHDMNANMFRKLQAMEGLAGVHVMPVTEKGRQATARLIGEGVLQGVLPQEA